jgi:hypothetical protein
MPALRESGQLPSGGEPLKILECIGEGSLENPLAMGHAGKTRVGTDTPIGKTATVIGSIPNLACGSTLGA